MPRSTSKTSGSGTKKLARSSEKRRREEANQRATEMLGYSHDELLHLSARDVSAEVNQSVDVLSKLLNG